VKRLYVPTLIVFLSLAGCRGGSRQIDLLPIDPDFDLHVEAVISDFSEVYDDFVKLLHDFNNHLFSCKHGEPEEMEAYAAYYDGEILSKAYIDTTLSSLERLDILDTKIDALVDGAWNIERSFSAHYNRYHGIWNCEWAKFYSPVPENLAPATYIRCVEENLEGVAGFIQSLRLDFEDHIEEFHK